MFPGFLILYQMRWVLVVAYFGGSGDGENRVTQVLVLVAGLCTSIRSRGGPDIVAYVVLVGALQGLFEI
jgi:hypothetical protein